MRCRPMVVLPLPAPPWITTTPGRGGGDQLELPRVDQRRDLRQVAIHALLAPAGCPRPPARRAGCAATRPASPSPARPPARARPRAPRASCRRPARTRHRLAVATRTSCAVLDGQRPAGQDLPLDLALAEALLVVAALAVAVIQLADRRVPPVDDVARAGRGRRRWPGRSARRARSVLPARPPDPAPARAGAGGRSTARAGRPAPPAASARRSDTPCSRSICAISAGTSSSRASPISSRRATSSWSYWASPGRPCPCDGVFGQAALHPLEQRFLLGGDGHGRGARQFVGGVRRTGPTGGGGAGPIGAGRRRAASAPARRGHPRPPPCRRPRRRRAPA